MSLIMCFRPSVPIQELWQTRPEPGKHAEEQDRKLKAATEMIGFIGLGKMGAGMAINLLQSGQEVAVFARERQRIQPVLKAGAKWTKSSADLATSCDCIFTMLGGPEDVRAIYLGDDGLVENARPQTVLVDMTTSSADLARTIGQICAKRSLHFLDAPVTGGVTGAKSGQLTFMVGGAELILDRVAPYLECMGAKICHMGDVGFGQITKSCNQIAVAGILLGATEALNYADTQGLSVDKVNEVLSSGTAASPLIKSLGERLRNDGSKASFSISQFEKDLRIAAESAARNGEKISTVENCLEYCRKLESGDGGESGLQVLLEYYKSGHGFAGKFF